PMMTGVMRQIVKTGDLGPVMAMFQGRGAAPGFGAPPPWNARPGEQAVATGGGRGGGGVAAAGAPAGAPGAAAAAPPAAAAALDPSMFQQITPLFQIPGRPASGGFGLDFMQTLGFGNATASLFGGGASGIASGDYVV